ncbi:unnamed protein product [Moneuplotes crassus]|uniref:Uncharacterized protein n=1 Tax=Euplotes crassus TaxID=5936 RepID=A0AAD2D8B8_EUPCR|nr:unnamed protein product [Moneuplotes crassus]
MFVLRFCCSTNLCTMGNHPLHPRCLKCYGYASNLIKAAIFRLSGSISVVWLQLICCNSVRVIDEICVMKTRLKHTSNLANRHCIFLMGCKCRAPYMDLAIPSSGVSNF